VGRADRRAPTDNFVELTWEERQRIFNLGYFTWVEQQGVSIQEFEARRDPSFWTEMRERAGAWDELIDELNARARVLETL